MMLAEDRALDINDALIWMRRQDVQPDDIDDLTALSRLGSIPMTPSAAEGRKQQMESCAGSEVVNPLTMTWRMDSQNWIRYFQ